MGHSDSFGSEIEPPMQAVEEWVPGRVDAASLGSIVVSEHIMELSSNYSLPRGLARTDLQRLGLAGDGSGTSAQRLHVAADESA